jgi:hypothetical protein
MGFQPLYTSKPKNVRDTLSGKFVPSGKQKTATVLTGAGVSKRNMSQAELGRRKKLQSKIAVTTSTLGLGALGLKVGSVGAARGASKFTKLARSSEGPASAVHEFHAHTLKERSNKLSNAAINTGIVSSGIGGVGGYNFASYTKAESKQRQPLKKNWESGMDFGLGGIHQGEEVSKKLNEKLVEAGVSGMTGGLAATIPTIRLKRKRKEAAQRGAETRAANAAAIAKFEVPKLRMPNVKLGDAAKMTVKGSVINPPGTVGPPKVGGGSLKPLGIAGGTLGAAGVGMAVRNQQKKKDAQAQADGQEIGKRADWMNISEHERRGRDSRRTAHRASNVAGGAVFGGALVANHGLYGDHHYGDPIRQTQNVFRTATKAPKYLKVAAKNNPHGAGILGAAGVAAAATGVVAGARANEKRHDRAISRIRQQKAIEKSFTPISAEEVSKLGPAKIRAHSVTMYEQNKKNGSVTTYQPSRRVNEYKGKTRILRRPQYTQEYRPDDKTTAGIINRGAKGKSEVYLGVRSYRPSRKSRKEIVASTPIGKAYDPERNRRRRLDHWSTASAVGAGATGTGALVVGRKAIGKPSKQVWQTKGKVHTKVTTKPTGLYANSGKEVRGAVKGLGRAGALGVTAAGLAIGSDRIRQYKKGRGRSYTPMHTIGY